MYSTGSKRLDEKLFLRYMLSELVAILILQLLWDSSCTQNMQSKLATSCIWHRCRFHGRLRRTTNYLTITKVSYTTGLTEPCKALDLAISSGWYIPTINLFFWDFIVLSPFYFHFIAQNCLRTSTIFHFEGLADKYFKSFHGIFLISICYEIINRTFHDEPRVRTRTWHCIWFCDSRTSFNVIEHRSNGVK